MVKRKVGVVGLGYVGLPLATLFAEKGFDVIAYDRDATKVSLLSEGVSYIEDVSTERLQLVYKSITPTTDPSVLSEAECISVCVPTPIKAHKPHLDPIMGALHDIKDHVMEGAVIVIESTVYPKFTEEKARPLFPHAHVVFSSERVDPNNEQFEIKDIPKVLGADSEEALAKARSVYSELFTLKEVSSTAIAETSKLLENTYRAVNIALVNELARVCARLEIDVWEVISAAATKPFGFQAFYPSLGVGGHCIPVDPYYLLHKGDITFVRMAMGINESMPSRCLTMAAPYIKNNVLILGTAYKPNISDYRESPSIELLTAMRHRFDCAFGTESYGHACAITYYDPHVPEIELRGGTLKSMSSLESALAWADCVLVCVAHSAFDKDLIKSKSAVLFDFCGLFRDDKDVQGL